MATSLEADSPPKNVALGQAGRFGLVGLANTVIDFGAFSVLRLLGIPLVVSNLASTSLGMSFSFFANRRFVFSSQGGWKRQALLFFLGTAFSMYVLQSLVILAITHFAPGVLDLAVSIAAWLGLRSETWTLLVRSNTAKVGATFVSLTWNFLFYRFAVFAPAKSTPGE